MKSHYRGIILVIAILLIASLACGQSTSQKLENASKSSTQQAVAVSDSGGSSPTTEVKPTQAPVQPTAAPKKPTPTPKPKPQDLILSQEIPFIQDGQDLLPVFTIENPNQNYAYESTEYQIAVKDDSGNVLDTDSGYIDILLPGQKLTYTTGIYLDEGLQAASVEVQLNPSEPDWMDEPVETFSVSKQTFLADENLPKASAVLTNNLNHTITDARVSVVGYDEADQVVAAGYMYVSFVPASGETGVATTLNMTQKPARVEFYPTLSGLSDLEAPSQEAPALNLIDYGFGQDETTVGAGYIVENPDPTAAVEDSLLRIIVYDGDGMVIGAEETSISILLPGEKLGHYTDVYLTEGTKAAAIEVQIDPGDKATSDLAGPIFSTEQVQYLPDSVWPKSSGMIVNNLSKDIKDLRVSSLAFDEKGAIIGGGYTYLDFLPGSGKAAVEMSLTSSQEPAEVQIYPTLSSLSELQEAEAGSGPIQLVAQGFSQDSFMVGVAFLVKNTDPDNAIEGTQYQVAVYNAAGAVLDTDSGYLDTIFKGSTTAGYSSLVLPDGEIADHVDIQISSGEPSTAKITENPFTVDQITFLPDEYMPKVTGIVLNSLSKKVSTAMATAVAYDDQGNIIGGGFTFIDFIPANATAPVEISLIVKGTPAKVEIYISLSSLSDLE